MTANVAFAVLKYAALTAAGVLLFRWGQGYALAERGYKAIGGEAVAFRVAAVLVSDGNHDPRYRAGLPEGRPPQMKIKSIAAICKKNKQVVLFNRYSDSGTLSQYIGDGNAVYPISGLPELDEESILTIFDVPEKQREDWHYGIVTFRRDQLRGTPTQPKRSLNKATFRLCIAESP